MVKVKCYIFIFEERNGIEIARWWNNIGSTQHFTIDSKTVREYSINQSKMINEILG